MKKMKQFAVLLLGSCFSFAASNASAELLYGTTIFRNLISFDSATPGTLIRDVPITGLVDQLAGEQIAGIDFRAANGALYAWANAPGSIYRLYTLNTSTGLATRVPGNVDFNNPTGTFWGVDFNPQADRIRIVNDVNQSFRFNPNTGAFVLQDTPLNPTGNVVAAAYDQNTPGTLTTTLFAIDSNSDQLVRIGGVNGNPTPNGGVVTTIGALGVNTANETSFDISRTGVAYAALSPTIGASPSLYTVNLNTGAASLVGTIGDGTLQGLTGMSAFAPVPEPSSAMLIGVGLLIGTVRRRR